MIDFVRMLAYDAIVGNNDRHYYNWGVIQRNLSDNKTVEFAPIYDTARALFWNHSDKRILSVFSSPDKKRRNDYLRKYVDGSQPKTGWNDIERINHFDLIARIAEEFPQYKPTLLETGSQVRIEEIEQILNEKFSGLMIPERRELIIECLSLRIRLYMECVY